METGKWKMEAGNWKMETGKWKFENGKWGNGNRLEPKTTIFQFPISIFQFPFSTAQGRECESRLFEGWRETPAWRKFITNSHRVAESSREERNETIHCDVSDCFGNASGCCTGIRARGSGG